MERREDLASYIYIYKLISKKLISLIERHSLRTQEEYKRKCLAMSGANIQESHENYGY